MKPKSFEPTTYFTRHKVITFISQSFMKSVRKRIYDPAISQLSHSSRNHPHSPFQIYVFTDGFAAHRLPITGSGLRHRVAGLSLICATFRHLLPSLLKHPSMTPAKKYTLVIVRWRGCWGVKTIVRYWT